MFLQRWRLQVFQKTSSFSYLRISHKNSRKTCCLVIKECVLNCLTQIYIRRRIVHEIVPSFKCMYVYGIIAISFQFGQVEYSLLTCIRRFVSYKMEVMIHRSSDVKFGYQKLSRIYRQSVCFSPFISLQFPGFYEHTLTSKQCVLYCASITCLTIR